MGFNFSSRFQYIAAPPIGDGPGGSGGTGTSTGTPITESFLTSLPGGSYVDIFDDLNGAQWYKVKVLDNSFYGIKFLINKEAGVVLNPVKLINQSGLYIPNSSAAWTWKRPTGFVNGTEISIKRIYGAEGKFSDTINWYNTASHIDQTLTTNYLVLAQAVPVCQLIDDDAITVLAPNSTTPTTVGDTYKLNKSYSRGKAVANTWAIFKTDPAGTFSGVPAVLGTDYTFVDGTNISSDEIHIQFTQMYNYEVRLTTSGHTFLNNPYEYYPAIQTGNSATSTYYFTTTDATIDYEIKVPKIDFTLDVPPAVLLGSDPFETYQNQLITVTPTLDLSTGYWKKVWLDNSNPPVTLTKSDSEWRAEITAKCDVILEARKKDTNELETTRIGLDPFTISLSYAIHYNLQFKTTLK